MLEQLILIFAHPEEVGLFLEFGGGATAVRAVAFEQLSFGPESFTGCAIPVFIVTEVNIAVGFNLFKLLLDRMFVSFLSRANEVGMGDIQLFPERLKTFHHPVCQFQRGFAIGLGGGFNLLPMLIGPGQKSNFIASRTLIAGHDIASKGGIGVADMRDVIDVIDRRRDIKSIIHLQRSLSWIASNMIKCFQVISVYSNVCEGAFDFFSAGGSNRLPAP